MARYEIINRWDEGQTYGEYDAADETGAWMQAQDVDYEDSLPDIEDVIFVELASDEDEKRAIEIERADQD